jgi:hypothetical protein
MQGVRVTQNNNYGRLERCMIRAESIHERCETVSRREQAVKRHVLDVTLIVVLSSS